MQSDTASRPLPWYALKVRSASEVRISKALAAKGLENFLPTFIQIRKYSDRLKKVDSPLFPGYLFARLDILAHRIPAVTTAGVEGIVSLGPNPQIVPEHEIEQIRQIVARGSAIPWPYLKEGDTVKLTYGPLQGVEGVLISCEGTSRLVVSIHLLQRSIALDIDRTWIRPMQSHG